MERFPEFVANHPILVAALMLTIGAIIGLEIQRVRRTAKALTPSQATRLSNSEDAVFIDTRGRKDFEAGHLPAAHNVPAAEVEQHLKQLEKHRERPLVLYDHGGLDAQRAAKALARNGFTRLYELDGGLPAWRKADLPIEDRSSAKKKKKSG